MRSRSVVSLVSLIGVGLGAIAAGPVQEAPDYVVEAEIGGQRVSVGPGAVIAHGVREGDVCRFEEGFTVDIVLQGSTDQLEVVTRISDQCDVIVSSIGPPGQSSVTGVGDLMTTGG
ncbi:MAG TPA: hypothetical protein VNO79_08380 [Actinomycetota bacterium]|nr:hypothetical protein [Actinomycetota bacterium]